MSKERRIEALESDMDAVRQMILGGPLSSTYRPDEPLPVLPAYHGIYEDVRGHDSRLDGLGELLERLTCRVEALEGGGESYPLPREIEELARETKTPEWVWPEPAAEIEGCDSGIKPYVEALRAEGIETFESCEGSQGHAFPEPTVRFHGGQGEGFVALGVAQRAGLPIGELRQSWSIQDGAPTGPCWELTFVAPAVTADDLSAPQTRQAASSPSSTGSDGVKA